MIPAVLLMLLIIALFWPSWFRGCRVVVSLLCFVGFDLYFSLPKMEHLKFIVIERRSGFLFRDRLVVTFFGVYHGWIGTVDNTSPAKSRTMTISKTKIASQYLTSGIPFWSIVSTTFFGVASTTSIQKASWLISFLDILCMSSSQKEFKFLSHGLSFKNDGPRIDASQKVLMLPLA